MAAWPPRSQSGVDPVATLVPRPRTGTSPGLVHSFCGQTVCTRFPVQLWSNPQLRAAVADGLPGWHRLVLLLVHEYMHDQASSLGHVHDVEFYQAFHDALFARNIQRFALWAFARHCRRSPDVTKVHLSQLASLCEVDAPVVDGTLEPPEQINLAA